MGQSGDVGGGPDEDGAEELCFLVGETCVGKSALALELAEAFGAELVSLDSMLVYRGMDVGTAKPGPAELRRVPHHVLDRVEPNERYDVTRYLADAEEALAAIRARGRPALVVGGTGLYLKALLAGLFDGPAVDPELRAALRARAEAEGAAALHAELGRLDPPAAARIHPHDERRVTRALEVWHQTGRPISAWQREWGWDGGAPRERPALLVGLTREPAELEARILLRTRAMLARGWAEEARAIRDGVGFGPTSIQALGYREVLDFVDGRATRAETETRIALRTRQFARRQRTWFRRFPAIRWESAKAATIERIATAFGWSR